jgi:hypothetical protein
MMPFVQRVEETGQQAADPQQTEAMLGGAVLLETVRQTIAQYAVLPSEESLVAVVLWLAATHGVDRFDHATRLAIHSPMKRCGKSRLLEVVAPLAHEPMQTTNVSVPALFRMIEAAGERPPTLLLDEADQIFGSARKDEQNADLVAALNNGFRRGSPTYRCVGPKHAVAAFSTFAFAAIAGIGRLPGTIEDRAINITMRRRLPGEHVAKFRLRTDLPRLKQLGEEVSKWVQSIKLSEDVPVPDALEDRAADAWEPLLAVADAAGGKWPQLAREAAVRLSSESADEEQSLDVRLLADMKVILGDTMYLSTASVLQRLCGVEDAPWADFDLTARGLSIRLGKFGVKPRRNSTGTERGYHASDFKDPFSRYLPSVPSEPSGAPPELVRCADTSKRSDELNRQSQINRQDETPGTGMFLTLLTGLTPTALAPGSAKECRPS